MRELRTCALVWFLLSLLPSVSRADEAADRARQHNQTAKKHFSVGLFEQAAEEYTRAYQAKPLPVFLFNLAQCHKRMAGRVHLERAVFYFKSYLQNEPASPMREDIEAEITRLERQLRTLPAVTPLPRTAPVGPTSEPAVAAPRSGSTPIYRRWWFWTLIGAAVAGAAAGAAAGLTHTSGPATDRSLDLR